MTLREKQSLFSFNMSLLVLWAYGKGYQITEGESYRTKCQQYLYFCGYKLMQIGSSLKLAKTRARSKTMQSQHLKKLARDINLFKDGVWLTKSKDYKPLGDFWVSLHPDNRWGGDWDKDGDTEDEIFKDAGHFEMR